MPGGEMNRSLVFSFFGRDVTAGRTMNRLGNTAQLTGSRMGRLGHLMATTAKVGALALGAAAVYAGKQVLDVGMAYQDSLNVFKAVSHATVAQMDAVAAKATALGANLKLPATSAADAAAAMTELAKGGLSVKQSMGAALGTLQLATAAGVDGAQAAQIQAAALNQFGLKGRVAGHVADVLANAANAASGEITDMSAALNYVGPVARSTGISLDDTGTAIALLAKNGILGSMAGTSLRGMLTSMASPSEKAAGALKALGVRAYDAQGNFVGLRKITDELTAARGRLTHEAFAAATADAFQKRNLAAVNVLASEGVKSWDKMGAAVTREGGAARVAAAKSKGLHGALSGLRSQLETVAITLYNKVSPRLEHFVRGLAKGVPGAVEKVESAFHRFAPIFMDLAGNALALADTFKPIVVGLAKIGGAALLTGIKALSAVMGFLADHARETKIVLGLLIGVYLTYKATLIATIAVERIENALKLITIARTKGLAAALVAQRGAQLAATSATKAGTAANIASTGSLVKWAGRIPAVGLAITALAGTAKWAYGYIEREHERAIAGFTNLALRGGASLQALELKYLEVKSRAQESSGATAAAWQGLADSMHTALGNAGVSLDAFGAKFINVANDAAIATSAVARFFTTLSTPPQPTSIAPGHLTFDPNTGTTVTPGGGGGSRGSSNSGYVAPNPSGTGTYTPVGSEAAKDKAAKDTANKLTKLTQHQASLLAKGILNGFRGASQHVLGKLTFALQDQLNRMADRVAKVMQKMADRVKHARDKMLADIKARKSMAKSIRDSLTGDLSGVFSTDAITGKNVMNNVGSFLGNQLAQLKTFVADLRKLRKAGLSARLLAMVANLGPSQGHQVATQLLSGAAGSISSLNRTERQIQAAGQAAGDTVAHATLDKQIAEDRKHYQAMERKADKLERKIERLIEATSASALTPEDIARGLRRLKRHHGKVLGLT